MVGAVTALHASPAGSAEIVAGDLEEYPDVWVDSSGRMHTAWIEYRFDQAANSAYDLVVHRSLPGSDAPDPAFGAGGTRRIPMGDPWEGGASSGNDPKGFGFTATGAIVVVWQGCSLEDCYAYQRAIERYDTSLTRTSRGSFLVPDYGNDATFVLDNGVVAFWTEDYAEPGVPRGSAVRFYSSATRAILGTLSFGPGEVYLPHAIRSRGSDGAVINRDGAPLVVSGWSNAVPFAVPEGCDLWPGPDGGLTRTCVNWGEPGFELTHFSGGGTQLWQRAISGFTPLGAPEVLSGGRVAFVGYFQSGGPGVQYAVVRVGPTGPLERMNVGSSGDSTQVAGPVELPGQKLGAAALFFGGRDSIIRTVVGTAGAALAVPTAPAAPVVVGGDGRVTVSWSAPSNGGSPITGYRVTPYRDGVAQAPVTVGNVTSRVFTGLMNGSSYRFTVAAINAVGRGPESPSSGTVVPGTLPGAPTNVRATATRGQASVTWSAPASAGSPALTRYVMTVIADGVALQARDIGPGTSEVVTGLSPGVLYQFKVAAQNAVGRGPDSAVSNTVTPPPTVFDSHDQAATRLSTELLGRAPTAGERSSWAGRMESGALSAGGLVGELRLSGDHSGGVDPVTRLYRAYFLRIPDRGGLVYWIAQRRSGRSLRSISDYFARSAEFARLYGSLTNRQFVERIYTNILGRPGEPSGVDFWTGELDSGRRSRGTVMIGFSESSEYKRTQSSEVDVSVLYILLLGRAPTAAEFAADVAYLDGPATTAQLAQRIITSTEYAQRSAP